MPLLLSIYQIIKPLKLCLSTGLTALHFAVINDDLFNVRTLFHSKEPAIDEQTPIGATPSILASLYRTHNIFFYLRHNAASIFKYNFKGFTYIDYTNYSDFIKLLLKKYKTVAREKLRVSGRQRITDFLRLFSSTINQGFERSSIIINHRFKTPLSQSV